MSNNPFTANDRGLATGSHDAQRASIPTASSTETSFTRTSNGNGGVDRVNVRSGAGAPEQVSGQPSTPGFKATDLNRGTSRVTISNGVETSNGDGYSKATSNMTEGREGVASIRSVLGSPKSGSDVRPDHIVRVGGMETTVQAAVASGFLRRAADGSYHDVGAQEIAQEEYEREQHRQEQMPKEATVSVLNDPAAEALVNTYVSSVPATQSQQVIGALIEGREVSTEHLAAVATARGVEPAQVAQEIAQMQTAFHEQVRSYVGDKVLEHARAHDMDALREAARLQVNTGSLQGYQQIAERHMLTLDRTDPQAIVTSEAGKKLGARIEKATGEVSIEIPGRGRTTWGAAIRAGLIQPYFPVRRR